MKVLYRYFMTEIIGSVIFTLTVFLILFTFFELIIQVDLIGRNNYQWKQALLYLFISLPNNIYELMPIAVLIGTIYTLSKFAMHSEFTIMHISSMSNLQMIKILVNISLIFSFITMLFGELVAPKTNELGKKIKLKIQDHTLLSQKNLSEFWIKNVIKNDKLTDNAVVGTRFLNIQRIVNDNYLEGVKIYQLDKNFHLTDIIIAASANYLGNCLWQLSKVHQTIFNTNIKNDEIISSTIITTAKMRVFISQITPEILLVLSADPNHMSVWNLLIYIQYLKNNNQRIEYYEIIFWKKLIYPLFIFVMTILALPFAYLHFRVGGVSLKIFVGIIVGVCFYLMNTLFAHLVLLNAWPAFMIAVLPSSIFILLMLISLHVIKQY